MKKVARLVEFSLRTRVIVDENATDDEIIRASYKGIQDKITNEELGDNLVEAELDEECPFGTFDVDEPSIDKVILNVAEKQYVVIGKGLPVRVIRFGNFSDWDSVNDKNGEPIFDIQIDEDEDRGKTVYNFQYVNLVWDNKEGLYKMGLDYNNAKELIVTETPIAQVVADLFQKTV